jgi:predicted DNA-binding transcriptional regulator YafY
MRSISPHDLTHAFERPDDFDPGSALAGVETPQASHTALVRLDNDVANVAVGRWRTARVVEGDESTTLVEIPFDTDFAVINWVLGFDARAEIVEPVALRERLIEYVGTGR